jgi:hypothetical protein
MMIVADEKVDDAAEQLIVVASVCFNDGKAKEVEKKTSCWLLVSFIGV